MEDRGKKPMAISTTPSAATTQREARMAAQRPADRFERRLRRRHPQFGGGSERAKPPSKIARLDDNGRLVHTEHAPERIADFTEGHVRPDGLENRGQEIVPAPGGPIDRLERASGAVALA